MEGNPKLKVVLKLGKKSNSSPNAVSQPIVFNEPRKSETGSFEFSEKSQVPSKPIVKQERQKTDNSHLKRKRIEDEEEYDYDAEIKEKQKPMIDQTNKLKITVNPSKKMKMSFSNFSTPTQPVSHSKLSNSNSNTSPQQLRPIIRKILQQFIKIDHNKIFMDPVTDDLAPGYSKIVTSPMCFKMMMEAESNNKYDTIQKFVYDFQLMCANCLTYNPPESTYYQDGVKMRDEGLQVIQKILGYIPETNVKPVPIDNAQRQNIEMELASQNEEKEKKEEEPIEESEHEERITEPEPRINRLIEYSKVMKIGQNPTNPTQLLYLEPVSFTLNKQKLINDSRQKTPIILNPPFPIQLNASPIPSPENYQASLEKFIEDFPDSAKRLARYYHDYKMW